MIIREDDPRNEQAARLLHEHLEDMAAISPPESIHALDVEALSAPGITFWTAWDNHELLGCGALAQLDETHGEIKSMRTAWDHRRKGVAAQILEHIITEAKRRSYTRLSLETGSQPAFAPAHALYESYGFSYCEPFANYKTDPNSYFMTRVL